MKDPTQLRKKSKKDKTNNKKQNILEIRINRFR